MGGGGDRGHSHSHTRAHDDNDDDDQCGGRGGLACCVCSGSGRFSRLPNSAQREMLLASQSSHKNMCLKWRPHELLHHTHSHAHTHIYSRLEILDRALRSIEFPCVRLCGEREREREGGSRRVRYRAGEQTLVDVCAFALKSSVGISHNDKSTIAPLYFRRPTREPRKLR